MKYPILFRLALFFVCPLSLCGCYYAIPTIVEAVNQNRLQSESEGAILESNTGALKFVSNSDKITAEKLNAYISGYNCIMVGSWSLWPSYNTFTNHTLKSRSTDTISFPVVDGLEKGLDWLKKGISYEQVSMPELDEAIAACIAAGEKLYTDEQTSLPYFRNQMYRRDDMAGAKKIFPVLQKDYDNMIAAMNKAGSILIGMQKTETERRMTAYRAQKTMVGYNTEKSLLYAQEIVMLFNSPENSIADREKYIEGDRLIAEMTTALATQRKILNDIYPLRDRSGGVDSIHDHLTEMITSYHIMKKKKTARSFNRMMKRYSDAIESYNRSLKFTRPI